jgi:predicted site-specific integrase-resolvase
MPRKKEPKLEGVDDETAAGWIGISRRTLLRHLKAGVISHPPLKMGKNRRAWQVQDIQTAKLQLRERARE